MPCTRSKALPEVRLFVLCGTGYGIIGIIACVHTISGDTRHNFRHVLCSFACLYELRTKAIAAEIGVHAEEDVLGGKTAANHDASASPEVVYDSIERCDCV